VSAIVPPRPDVGMHPADERPVEDRVAATWRWWEVVLATLLGFLAGSLVATPVFLTLDAETGGPIGGGGLLAAAIVDVVLVALVVLWLRSAHPGWWRVIGWPRRGARLREASIGAGLGLLVQVGSAVVGFVVIRALETAKGERVEMPDQVSSGIEGWGLVALLLFAIVIAPTAEEFVFRGLLFRSIADRRGFWPGAIASSIPFGLTHAVPGRALGVWALMITLVFVGVALAWIHWRRRNLLANIAAHAVFNAIGVIVILSAVGA
jgi:uncharacterized protein